MVRGLYSAKLSVEGEGRIKIFSNMQSLRKREVNKVPGTMGKRDSPDDKYVLRVERTRPEWNTSEGSIQRCLQKVETGRLSDIFENTEKTFQLLGKGFGAELMIATQKTKQMIKKAIPNF